MGILISRRRGYAEPPKIPVLEFTDDAIKAIAVANWGGVTGGSTGIAGVADEVTVQQANAVTSFGSVFNGALTTSEDFNLFPNVKTLGDNAFGNYAGNVFKLPTNIKTIGHKFLYNSSGSANTNTTRVEFGANVTTVGQWCCRYRKNIQTIVCYATTPPTLNSYPFRNATAQDINTTFKIYVPDNSVDAYKAASQWSRWSSRILPLSHLT